MHIILHYLNNSNSVAYLGIYWNIISACTWKWIACIFDINLSSGATSGSFYVSNLSKTSIIPSDISYSDTTNFIYILMRYSTGFTKFEFDPRLNTFSSNRASTTIIWHYISVKNGFSYFGGQYLSNSDVQFAKLIENGDFSQDKLFVIASTADNFAPNTFSGYRLSYDITIAVSQFLGFLTSASTISFYNSWTYNQTVSESLNSDIVYDGIQQV